MPSADSKLILIGALAALAASACSYLPGAASEPTEMTGQCLGELAKIGPLPVEDQIVPIDIVETIRPGDAVVFSWPDPAPGSEGLDDFIAQCWTRDGWRSAWIETGSFGVGQPPQLLVEHWGDNPAIVLSTTRYLDSDGVLLVPSTAPSGFYRFQLIRITGTKQTEWTTGEARFRVDR